MSTENIINDEGLLLSVPSRFTLMRAPARALKLITAIATDGEIAKAMRGAGYTVADHQEGWRRLCEVSGKTEVVGEGATNATTTAIDEIDSWIGPGFRRAHAALNHKHPEQCTFVFAGLHVARGGDAVVAVKMFLDRCDALEDSSDRKNTRKADHAALATLEKRGIGEKERKRLRSLVAMIELPSVVETMPTPEQDDRTKKLIALHAWVQDWSETARAVIKNRSALIRLGAVQRRRTPAPPPVVAQPVTPPAPQLPAAPSSPALPSAAPTTMSANDAAPSSKRVA